MHRLLPVQKPTQWWSPKLSPGWVRFWRPFRRLMQRKLEKLYAIEVRGLEYVRRCLDQGHGMLITPNHFAYADPMVLYEAADQLGRPFYFMTAWQVFGTSGAVKRLVLRQHGCFSVDRDGADMRAFRQAVDILQMKPQPLVVFPEGEMYHSGDRVTPFREGPAAIARAAAKRAQRPIACVPCALKYYYMQDPTPELLALMDRLEQSLHWRPRPDLNLDQRIYRLAEGALALKEIEYLGKTSAGSLSERIGQLSESVLWRLEENQGLVRASTTVPERVKRLRQSILKKLETLPAGDPKRHQCDRDLEDAFLVVQLFCYPGNYVSAQPTIERIADTLDKLEEDILGVPIAGIRGPRGAIVAFGEPIAVDPSQMDAGALTQLLEQRVQALLDGIVISKPV